MSNQSLAIINQTTPIEFVDPETGFITFQGQPFTAKAKVEFLKLYEKTGEEAWSMRAVGNKYNKRTLTAHKNYDKAFGEACRDTTAAMVNKLEGTMYIRGLDPKGTLDRFGWLRAHAPEKYAPKATKDEPNDAKKKLEELYSKAIDVEAIVTGEASNVVNSDGDGKAANSPEPVQE